MWKKTLLAGAAAVVLAGSSMVYAQQGGAGAGDASGAPDPHAGAGRPSEAGHGVLSAEDRAAFLDARIAALKAGLQLTADQEKNWPAFESALRNLAKLRAERLQARFHPQEPANEVERLRRRAEALSSIGAALKQLADAEEPLLASLTDAQKHRFDILSRIARERAAAFMQRGAHPGWHGGMGMPAPAEHWQHPGWGGEGHGWRGRGMGPHGESGDPGHDTDETDAGADPDGQ